jgi:DNA modification methylase
MKPLQKLLYDPVKEFLVDENCWQGSIAKELEWQVINGDSREVLSKFSDNTFDCVVTSPPYFWLRHYGVDNQIGLEETVTGYVDVIALVMDEVYRVLKPKGLLFLNLSDTYYSGKGQPKYADAKSSKRRFGLRAVDKSGGLDIGIQRKSMIGIPWRVAIEMTKRKWILRSNIIWHRKYPLPEKVKDRPKRSYEHVFMFSKGRAYHFNQKPLLVKEFDQDVWTIPARPKANGIDTASYPDELVKRCLDIGCIKGGKVLDPFAGSGTTLRVAVESGHSAVGIDLNKEFCEYMVKELSKVSIVNE